MSSGNDKAILINKAAEDVIALARSTLLVDLRFLDSALGRLQPVSVDGASMSTDGSHLFYGPLHVLRSFKAEAEKPVRDYLHVLMHCIYSHMFVGQNIDRRFWDLACDIAVESSINDLGLRAIGSLKGSAQASEAAHIRDKAGALTAEKIYRYLRTEDLPESELDRLAELFKADDHSGWYKPVTVSDRGGDDPDSNEKYEDGLDDTGQGDPMQPTASPQAEADWEEIAEKVQDALETFFKGHGDNAEILMQNLRSVNREKYDYTEFLRKFAVYGENPGINDEEFDYIMYTYGLQLYENMPLVEPLEYKEIKRIREFVIAIDTSGSTWGELVQKFLQKTYNILRSTESYFSRVNIHVIQCDAAIQEHIKITSDKDFDKYIKTMSMHGGGGTDFRPVFSFVDELINRGEFTDLKGLIYFTDGYGTFPSSKPDYDTAFVFLDNEYNKPEVPPWAIRLVLGDEDI